MSDRTTKNTPVPVRRAEGLPVGCCAMPFHPWSLDPARELPGRLEPMFVLPPPERSRLHRLATATLSLGGTIATGAGLMVLAQYLTTPG
jgi:hypothetical protein